ncbi:MAG: hypothetical protein IPP90_05925 [Gemmatimonadaceae bacterium]|nr:hypothetical protein [Gemmatimonadaceae bacterium]
MTTKKVSSGTSKRAPAKKAAVKRATKGAAKTAAPPAAVARSAPKPAAKTTATKSAAKKSAVKKVAAKKLAGKATSARAKSRAALRVVESNEEDALVSSSGTSLVIVESPAKAKTIGKYLGRGYTVRATVGHVRDLPAKKLGIDIEHGFAPRLCHHRGQGRHSQRPQANRQGRQRNLHRHRP